MSKVQEGQIWARNNTGEQYVVLACDGNNPAIPTNTKLVHLIWKWKKKGIFAQTPQEFITVPLDKFETYFKFVSNQ